MAKLSLPRNEDIPALLDEAHALLMDAWGDTENKGRARRYADCAGKLQRAADWMRTPVPDEEAHGERINAVFTASADKHRPPSDPVSRRLRALYGHRPYGECIGIPWSEWAALKEEYMAHYHITDLVRNDRYPDAVLLTHDEREASAVVRSATDQVRGWFFFPVIR